MRRLVDKAVDPCIPGFGTEGRGRVFGSILRRKEIINKGISGEHKLKVRLKFLETRLSAGVNIVRREAPALRA
jgi:hypothetical protein